MGRTFQILAKTTALSSWQRLGCDIVELDMPHLGL